MRSRMSRIPQFNPLTNPTPLPDGRIFVPTHAPLVDEGFAENPLILGRASFPFADYAQMFVGLRTGRKIGKTPKGAKFSIDNLRTLVRNYRHTQLRDMQKVSASLIPQRGLWQGGREDSAQILLLRVDAEPAYSKFIENILALAEWICEDRGQESVIINFYRAGKPDVVWEVTLKGE